MIERRARWRLTVGFASVQLITYAVFALTVYVFVTSTFDFDGIEDGGSVLTAEAGFGVLRNALLPAFAGLAIVAPLTSWVLAGLAMRPVARTLAAQRRFVDDASHEMRTPLTAIQSELELALRAPRTTTDYRRACARALDAAYALTATTDDLLLASESPHDRPGVGVAQLGDVVLHARGLLEEPNRVRVEVIGRPWVDGSATAVQRAVLNILVNACRYSAAAKPVEVRVGSQGRWGLVQVTDHGVGMTRTESRRAFDRFWQADASRASAGSGLGLSIVREIVGSLRGRVTLTSSPGLGTTVTLRLPLSRSSHDRLRTVELTADSVGKGSQYGK